MDTYIPAEELLTWDLFKAAVRVHEMGHVDRFQLGIEGLQAVADAAPETLCSVNVDVACDQVDEAAAQAAVATLTACIRNHEIYQAMASQNDFYDITTNHGVTQGCTLDP